MWKGLAGALVGAIIAAVGFPVASAWAATIFSPNGTFGLPEGIIPAPGGGYLVSDANNDSIYFVPAAGGTPPAVGGQQPMNFSPFGEILLPAGYSNSGTYLAYGANNNFLNDTKGIAALVGTSGISPPTPVINTPHAWYGAAAVAPSSYGSIAAGSVVLSNGPHSVSSSSIEVLKTDLLGTTHFAPTVPGIAFGVGFAPAGFNLPGHMLGGQMFVSDAASGNIYTVSTSGQVNPIPFATLSLPGPTSGLRQFAWAPADFGPYSGDLFVSVAAQNGGGGINGVIDVLDANGGTPIAQYAVGTALIPLDPRGLLFIGSDELLISNADASIVEASPSDFVAVLPVPEPGTVGAFLAGLIGLGIFRQRRFRFETSTAVLAGPSRVATASLLFTGFAFVFSYTANGEQPSFQDVLTSHNWCSWSYTDRFQYRMVFTKLSGQQWARIDLYSNGNLTNKDAFGGKVSFEGASTLVITNYNGKVKKFEYDGKIYQTPGGPMIQYLPPPPVGKMLPCDDERKLNFPNP